MATSRRSSPCSILTSCSGPTAGSPVRLPPPWCGARPTVAARAISFALPAAFVRPALVNGAAGVVVADGDQPLSVMGFTVAGGRIVAIEVLADPDRLRELDLTDWTTE